MEEKIFDTENNIVVKISNAGAETLIDEDCCTCINIILKNDGRIATSFLGCHNKYIIKQLEYAQKKYFKSLKKTLKNQIKNATPTTEYESGEQADNKDNTKLENKEAKIVDKEATDKVKTSSTKKKASSATKTSDNKKSTAKNSTKTTKQSSTVKK